MAARGYAPEIGEKFGGWTVLGPGPKAGRQLRTACRCECGQERLVENRFLKNGQSSSCGCRRAAAFVERNTTHGLSKVHPVEFRAWDAMIYRCHDPRCDSFKDYGARGIAVCDRWRNGEDGRTGFECFLDDVGKRPSPKHSLDRIENDAGYKPGNVRWADKREQAQNRRNTKRYLFRGEHLTPTEIRDRTGVPSNTFFMRVERYGWPVERAATTPTLQSGRA